MSLWVATSCVIFMVLTVSKLLKHLIGKKDEEKKEIQNETEPEFSTTLSTPIEDIIEETISEEALQTATSKKKLKVNKNTSKCDNKEKKSIYNEKTKKCSKKNIDEDDPVGYSFFKSKTVEKAKREASQVNDQKKIDAVEDYHVDDIGFSFPPVKGKGKKFKNTHDNKYSKKSNETLNTVVENTIRKTKGDPTKPSIIDHFKSTRSRQALEPVPVVTKKFTNNLEKVQQFASSSENLLKESKKVTSSISYASVAKNSIEGSSNSDDSSDYALLETQTKSIVETYLQRNSEEAIINTGQTDGTFVQEFQITSKSTIQESQFDFIDANINKFVSSNGSLDKLSFEGLVQNKGDTQSKSSSISVVDAPDLEDEINLLDFNEIIAVEQRINGFVDEQKECQHNDIVTHSKTSSICIIDNFSIEGLDRQFEDGPLVKESVEATKVNIFSGDNIQENSTESSQYIGVNGSDFRGFIKHDVHERAENIQDTVSGRSEIAVEITLEPKTSDKDLTLAEEAEIIVNGQASLNENYEFYLKQDAPESGKNIVKEIKTQIEVNDLDTKSSSNTDFVAAVETEILVNGKEPFAKNIISPTIELIEQTKDFIQEEICVKKFSYTTETQDIPDTTKFEKLWAKMQPIRVLTLNDKQHQECTLYRIEKNWVLHFRVGPSLFGRNVYLYCNYPMEENGKLTKFERCNYQLLKWICDEGCQNADDTAFYAQITAKMAGNFHFYFTFEKSQNAEKHGSGYFLIDPVLQYGNDEALPLDCIQCQTVLSKNLGSFSTWEKKLRVAKESGYNMVHFTPIQQLGASNSCYSLSEQLQLNSQFKKHDGEMPSFEHVEELIAKLRKDWKMASVCDIVLNHTANESVWIQEHPEVTYNCFNCPYMRPAYLLDAALHQFSEDVKRGLYEDRGIPAEINSEDHLNAIRYHLSTSILEPLNIPELLICDVNQYVMEFLSLARTAQPTSQDQRPKEELVLEQDKEFRRLSAKINMDLAMKLYNVYWNDTFDEESRIKRCAEQFKNKLDSLNNSVIEEIKNHLTVALDNVIAGIRYYRVQADGPKFKEITEKTPLVYRYFTDHGTPKLIEEHEQIMYSSNGKFLMAHNGWVMNSDPLKNFAAEDSNVYIRRELIAWGDSVKLRFGDKPEDCPYLWEHMKKYVEQTASIFDGVRLDNCHSTPIPVAEYLLDCARRVRPDLYVVAELFTNCDMTDNIFVNRLGITSLIREGMSAWDSHEEGRLVYRYGGSPVGSFYQPNIRPLVPSVAHALFLDLTHDNPSPIEKRSVFDMLPSAALVNMACCASGSNRGYDELVPHHIHVVDETREYMEWSEDERVDLKSVGKNSGIVMAKKAINDLHFVLGKQGFSQVYVDQMDADIVAVTRHSPDTHQSYILVAFTAFNHPNEDAANHQRSIKPLRFEGVLEEIVLEASLSHTDIKNGGSKYTRFENFVKDTKWINGLREYDVTMKQHIQVGESEVVEKVESGSANVTQLNFKNFKPGSVIIVRTSLPESMSYAVKSVRNLIRDFSCSQQTELNAIISQMKLADLNRALYRCDQEERDEGFGFGTYNIPHFGSMVYSGLQGFMSLLANIRPNNDLGHPMCANLRDGNWMIDYIWKRLKLDEGTKELGEWIQGNTTAFQDIPRYLVPCYFDIVVTDIYMLLLEQSYNLMSDFVTNGSTFVKGLSLGSLQFGAYIKSANLPTLSPNLVPPKPPMRKNDIGEQEQASVTLSAGLPHFSVGYMRNWGRDTFIALRGMFILTGRYQETREHILGYAACLRHGLIPNLLDGGRNSRYNCRDAVWWWLYCIKKYVEEAPNGITILTDKVSRIFPQDDSQAHAPGEMDQPLHDVIQEALHVHFQGLVFRERNAGRQIDEQMTDPGFNNQIGVHPETGFVFGGNRWNCGTWMDKMGSSEKAGNKGKPATPRDGSAIEIIGLSKCTITWLAKLSQENKYPYNGVERTHKNGKVTKWTFQEWSEKIQANFEKHFWVNTKATDGEIRPDLINKRGIYKDSYGSSYEYTDLQLRCNFPIAMVAAPELFTPQNAWTALAQAEKYLLGPLGMKTLDPEDWAYRGDYDNSNDSNDPSVANGFNYHQGPEWLWPVGFFLRAKLHFAAAQNGALQDTVAITKLILSKHFTELQTSDWRGLPELTNSNGAYCKDSSRTQAWSMACILEVLHDLQKLEAATASHLVN